MYPTNSPGFAANSETSREAADRLTGKDELQGFILTYLKNRGPNTGSTVDEAKERCESHFERNFDRSTIAARFTELTECGQIVLTSDKRLTPHNRKAGVYVHKDFAPVGMREFNWSRKKAKKMGANERITILELLCGQLYQALLQTKADLARNGFKYCDQSNSVKAMKAYERMIK